MHYAGIIIKPKVTTVRDARFIFGEYLVKIGIADWYSSDDYRERTFDGRQEISLDEFKTYFEDWAEKDELFTLPFCSVDEDEYLDELSIPNEYWEFYSYKEEREELLKMTSKLYQKYVLDVISKKQKEQPNYFNVILIDYHN